MYESSHSKSSTTVNLSSTRIITDAMMELYERIVDKNLLVRRVTISANHVVHESTVSTAAQAEQLDMFSDYEEQARKLETEQAALEREKRGQQAIIALRKKFGKNAVLKGMNLQEGATTKDRNAQVGGHKA